jgi:hypothetical protein
MANALLRLGSVLLISRKNKQVRGILIILLANFLLFTCVVFTVEIILIFLGMGDIQVPLTEGMRKILARLVF